MFYQRLINPFTDSSNRNLNKTSGLEKQKSLAQEGVFTNKSDLLFARIMHLAGLEPAMSLWEADYESDAFDHLATDAVGAGGNWTHVHLKFENFPLSNLKTKY